MTTSSYLLVLDNSAESMAAAQFAWQLANESCIPVNAQYVIDTESVRNLVPYEKTGFVGSGIFLDAREKILTILRSVAESVMMSYESQTDGRLSEYQCYIDEGKPVYEICARAREHALVIVGYNPRQAGSSRLSLIEQLAENCPCPVLALGAECHGWSKMQVILSRGLADDDTVKNIYSMGRRFGLPTELYLGSGVDQVDPDSYLLGCWSRAVGVHDVKVGSLKDRVAAAAADTLMVVGAELVVGPALARNRGLVRKFLAGSSSRGVLFWPERSHTPATEQAA